MNRKLVMVVLGVLVVGVGASSALAGQDEASGFYAGGGIGRSDITGAEERSGDTDAFAGKDQSWGVYGGYQFCENFSVEVGWLDLGEAQDDDDAPDVLEVDGWTVSVLGILPVSDMASLYVRGGVLGWSIEQEDPSDAETVDEDGESLAWGVGLEVKFAEDWRLRAGWDYYEDVGETGDASDPGEVDIDTLSASVSYHW